MHGQQVTASPDLSVRARHSALALDPNLSIKKGRCRQKQIRMPMVVVGVRVYWRLHVKEKSDSGKHAPRELC